MVKRLITISYTGLNAAGGVPKFNRDLHWAFRRDRECIHYCWDNYPFSDRPDMAALPEWDRARTLNLYLLKDRKITRDDTVVADGFWAWGLESIPHAISHSHGIWGHVTWKDVQRGLEPENPFHHAAQIAFRGNWTRLKKRLTAVSQFIADEMHSQWGFEVDRVIDNGVDTETFKPMSRATAYSDFPERPLIIHGVNDPGNTNKGWDHIEHLVRYVKGSILSLDEAHKYYSVRSDRPWKKHEVLAQADLVVHPSGFEGNSMFVAEALACGVPVVGYDVGFLYSLRRYDMSIGRVMDRDWRSPDTTLRHVQDVLSKDNDRDQQGKQARKVAEDFLSIEQFRHNWRDYIDDVEDGCYDA